MDLDCIDSNHTKTHAGTLEKTLQRSPPFETAREPNPGPLPSASVARDLVTSSATAAERQWRQESKSSRDTSITNSSSNPILPPYALLTNSTAHITSASSTTLSNMFVHSVDLPSTPHVPENAFDSATYTSSIMNPIIPKYTSWSAPEELHETPEEHIYLDHLMIPEPSPYDQNADYAKIRTPYSASQSKIFLENTGLLDRYPELCFKITHGFPLSNLAPVLESYCPPNLPSADFHLDVIREYIADKLRLGRFTGPYTKEELECLIGPFCQGTRISDLFRHAPMPHSAFRCRSTPRVPRTLPRYVALTYISCSCAPRSRLCLTADLVA